MGVLTTPALPDAEQAVKAWVRSTGVVGQLAFLGLPAKASAYPVVVVRRVGGASAVVVDHPLIQVEVWGAPPEAGTLGRDRFAVGAVAYALASLVDSHGSGTVMGTGAVSGGASVTRGPVWSPDPDDRRSRYIFDAEWNIHAAGG